MQLRITGCTVDFDWRLRVSFQYWIDLYLSAIFVEEYLWIYCFGRRDEVPSKHTWDPTHHHITSPLHSKRELDNELILPLLSSINNNMKRRFGCSKQCEESLDALITILHSCTRYVKIIRQENVDKSLHTTDEAASSDSCYVYVYLRHVSAIKHRIYSNGSRKVELL